MHTADDADVERIIRRERRQEETQRSRCHSSSDFLKKWQRVYLGIEPGHR